MVLSIDDGDVEHFRPKGLITIEGFDPLSPGYYWMGADWNNLFLSCKHCNQSRVQPTPIGTKRTMGKKNQFPLSDNKKRARTHKKKIAEEEPYRLLIDPGLEDPLKFIDFDDQGMIIPKAFATGKTNLKGEVSIEVFALYRKKLVDARKMHALTVMAALTTYRKLSADLQIDMAYLPAARIQQKELDMEEEIKKLNVYTRPDQLFSAMSLTLIKNFLKKMGIDYKG
ncbi:MAG: hypothetical protein EOO20_15950 [Chryseobacterium sp.]|nr:MAG: hypothetical protein EOO20_15950 [Chryseobacterium sp.]